MTPLHKKSANAASSIVRVHAHGIDTRVRALEPGLPWEKGLGEHALGVLGTLRSFGIPSALDRLGPIWKRIFAEDEPFTATRYFACFLVNHVDQVREWILLACIPTDLSVECFVACAIFGSMTTDRVDSSENGAGRRGDKKQSVRWGSKGERQNQCERQGAALTCTG